MIRMREQIVEEIIPGRSKRLQDVSYHGPIRKNRRRENYLLDIQFNSIARSIAA